MRLDGIIRTPRLRIIDATPDDMERVVGWLNDKELMRYSGQRHKTHTIDTQRRYLDTFNGSPHMYLGVHDPELGLIGTFTEYHDTHNDVIDFGILIGVSGKGYGKEAFKAVLDHSLTRARKVTFGTVAANTAARRIAETFMEPDGIHIAHELIDGKPTDALFFARFA